MKFLEKLFKKEEVPKITYDIREPVISFVESVAKNPKRFDVDCAVLQQYENQKYYSWWAIKDKKTNEYFGIGPHPFKKSLFTDTSWLTEDEINYLLFQIENIYRNRVKRKEELTNKRKERNANKERERLMKIYCEK